MILTKNLSLIITLNIKKVKNKSKLLRKKSQFLNAI